jgi:tRNA (mo5U34)-methyltransferase
MTIADDYEKKSRQHLQECIDSVEFWWHSIDLGQGFVTKGEKSAALLEQELHSLSLPDLNGRTVLDIGAYDGFYSFTAEKLGAQRVVALDHYVWSIDLPRAIKQWRDNKMTKSALPPVETTEHWQPENLPGKRAFDTAHKALNSKVEAVVDDFMTMDLSRLGSFDVTLFMGVLYHMKNPLASLERLASVTKTLAVIETHAIELFGHENMQLAEFYSSDQLNSDPSNWWGLNFAAIEGMCLAAGFRRVELVGRPQGAHDLLKRAAKRTLSFLTRRPYYFRAVVHAWK